MSCVPSAQLIITNGIEFLFIIRYVRPILNENVNKSFKFFKIKLVRFILSTHPHQIYLGEKKYLFLSSHKETHSTSLAVLACRLALCLTSLDYLFSSYSAHNRTFLFCLCALLMFAFTYLAFNN
jgi:hypothetical protein